MGFSALDPEKLRKFSIPEIRENWTYADTLFYNLSIGIGSHHLAPEELKYVQHRDNLATLPSMATVMAHPGFWLEHPDSGVDPRCALHGEQTVELDGPLPAEADIVSQSRVGRLLDKGEGRDAILETITDLIDARTEVRLARLRRTTVLRKCGGFGGEDLAGNKPSARPDDPADIVAEFATLPQQALIYALNGDSNPLHLDPTIAANAGFPGPILQGLCTFGIATFLLAEAAFNGQPERMRSIGMRFSSPVYPGETLQVAIWNNGFFEVSTAARDQVVGRLGTFGTM